MFDTAPILWLQSWASPPLTAVMNGIALLGYTGAYLAIATLLAFLFRVRAAFLLFLVVTLNAVVVDVAKLVFATERPTVVDGRVQSLSLFSVDGSAEGGVLSMFDDTHAFPSGHVSAATASAVGLALVRGARRTGWAMAVTWIALMGLSRMYIGRHFAGDVIGGVVAGLVVLGVAFAVLKIDRLAQEGRAEWPARRTIAVALVFGAAAMVVGVPSPAEAGRLLGATAGMVILATSGRLETVSTRAGVMRFVAAGAGFGVAAFLVSLAPEAMEATYAAEFVTAAIPIAALLAAPAFVSRRRFARA